LEHTFDKLQNCYIPLKLENVFPGLIKHVDVQGPDIAAADATRPVGALLRRVQDLASVTVDVELFLDLIRKKQSI
jgi:hypothetical protein